MAAKETAAHCVVVDAAILRWQEWMTTTADNVLEQDSIVTTGDFHGAPPVEMPNPAYSECIKKSYVLQIMSELSADASCLMRQCKLGYVSKSFLLTLSSMQQGVARLETHLADAAIMYSKFDTVPSVADLAEYFRNKFCERLTGLTSLARRWHDFKAHTELTSMNMPASASTADNTNQNECTLVKKPRSKEKPAEYYKTAYHLMSDTETRSPAETTYTYQCCYEQPCTCFKLHTYTNANMLFLFATAKSIDMNAGIMNMVEGAPAGHLARSPCAKKHAAWRSYQIAHIAAGIASISAHLASRCSQ